MSDLTVIMITRECADGRCFGRRKDTTFSGKFPRPQANSNDYCPLPSFWRPESGLWVGKIVTGAWRVNVSTVSDGNLIC
jgi:hypothetical protein